VEIAFLLITTRRGRGEGKVGTHRLSLQECDVQLQAMARCDERIAKFEGLLAQMRADLYGSIEALSSKIEKTVVAPPKRSVPRIVSNIQLAPPRTNSNMQDNSNPDEFGTQFSDLESWTTVVDKRRKKQVRLDAPVRKNSNAVRLAPQVKVTILVHVLLSFREALLGRGLQRMLQ